MFDEELWVIQINKYLSGERIEGEEGTSTGEGLNRENLFEQRTI